MILALARPGRPSLQVWVSSGCQGQHLNPADRVFQMIHQKWRLARECQRCMGICCLRAALSLVFSPVVCRTMKQQRMSRYQRPCKQLWHRLCWLSTVSSRGWQGRSTRSSGSTRTLRRSQPFENATGGTSGHRLLTMAHHSRLSRTATDLNIRYTRCLIYTYLSAL